MTRRKSLLTISILASVLLVGLVAACIAFWHYTRARITIENASGGAVSNLQLDLVVDGRDETRQIETLHGGTAWTIDANTEIIVSRLTFMRNGQQLTYTKGGLATKAEVFVFQIGPDGSVTGEYRW